MMADSPSPVPDHAPAPVAEPPAAASVKPGKAPAQIPAELLAELRRDVLANRLFERMSPSHRREYIRWVADAKRKTTRVSRAEKAIALMLSKDDAPEKAEPGAGG